MKHYSPEEQAQWEKNMKQYQISTGQDPNHHGRLPFRIFDPGKGDPWRELHLVDADNKGVTTLGPLMDPTDMTLGNALFLMKCANEYESMVQEINTLKAKVSELQAKLDEYKGEV